MRRSLKIANDGSLAMHSTIVFPPWPVFSSRAFLTWLFCRVLPVFRVSSTYVTLVACLCWLVCGGHQQAQSQKFTSFKIVQAIKLNGEESRTELLI